MCTCACKCEYFLFPQTFAWPQGTSKRPVMDPTNLTLHLLYTDMPTKVPSLSREKSQEQHTNSPDVSIRNIRSILLVKKNTKEKELQDSPQGDNN